ncbi:MAG: sodium/proton antiporter NhaB [Pseudomonadota bacterium]
MTTNSLSHAFAENFLGHSPNWYKITIVAFLIANPLLLMTFGPIVTGWALLIQFIFTLTMALNCYPLQPGGLLALEALFIGLASPEAVYAEAHHNFTVILLLMFMVAGIVFMKDLLLFMFTKVLLSVRSKSLLSFVFLLLSAVLSAFLDALTVVAVLISVGAGFYQVYHSVHSQRLQASNATQLSTSDEENFEQFRAFLGNLLMHGAIGTALGGVCTIVGEPQNLLIAHKADWDFVEFFLMMAPISMPVLVTGIITCFVIEKLGVFQYGAKLPESIREVLINYEQEQQAKRTQKDKAKLIVQGCVAIFLIIGLAFHLAEVGLIGLAVIVLLTAFTGIIDESQLGYAFEEALPFTALLMVFFAIVAVIHEQQLFTPIIHAVLSLDLDQQPSMFFVANGLLSMISDNVFVATVYINEVFTAYEEGSISRDQFNKLAIAINTGTNIPSVATPNGQAAFLFLLTSALAPLLKLSYGRMVWMALPYTITLSTVGFLATTYLL